MNTSQIAFLASSALVILTGSAHADWQYTKWGMSPKQVVAASRGLARHAPDGMAEAFNSKDGSTVAKLTAPYSTGDFTFNALFLFDRSDKLSEVALDLNQGDPHELVGALESKYGKPLHNDPIPAGTVWMWRTEVDQIVIIMNNIHGNTETTLSYSPRHTANENGL